MAAGESLRSGPARPLSMRRAGGLVGRAVHDASGAALGRLEDIVSDGSGQIAAWLIVNELRFGSGRRYVVPAEGVAVLGEILRVPYGRDLIAASAGLASRREDPETERRLRAHYLLGDAA